MSRNLSDRKQHRPPLRGGPVVAACSLRSLRRRLPARRSAPPLARLNSGAAKTEVAEADDRDDVAPIGRPQAARVVVP